MTRASVEISTRGFKGKGLASQRDLLPEGIRESNSRIFYFSSESIKRAPVQLGDEGKNQGSLILYGRYEYRPLLIEDWEKYVAVITTRLEQNST